MDINKMLAEFRAERAQIEQAIIALERLARGSGKRRGRPPKWMTAMKASVDEQPVKRRRGRPPKNSL